MKMNIHPTLKQTFAAAILALSLFACKKDGNPNNLPPVNPADYEGKIDGYSSSDEVYPGNLIAYWSFEDSKNEMVTGTAPFSSLNDSYIGDGVRGKALNLAGGFVFFNNQFAKFKTDSLKSWTISAWVRILNNGSKKTMLFQIARPGTITGSINFILNTNSFPASNTTTLRIQPTFTTMTGGTQDNLNNNLSPVIGMDKWTHITLTYETTTGIFDIWSNGVKIGGFPSRGVGNNTFKCFEPTQVIIGSNYNGIPGMTVNTDVSFARMTGHVDEIRMYNKALPDAQIKALYNLGKANK